MYSSLVLSYWCNVVQEIYQAACNDHRHYAVHRIFRCVVMQESCHAALHHHQRYAANRIQWCIIVQEVCHAACKYHQHCAAQHVYGCITVQESCHAVPVGTGLVHAWVNTSHWKTWRSQPQMTTCQRTRGKKKRTRLAGGMLAGALYPHPAVHTPSPPLTLRRVVQLHRR